MGCIELNFGLGFEIRIIFKIYFGSSTIAFSIRNANRSNSLVIEPYSGTQHSTENGRKMHKLHRKAPTPSTVQWTLCIYQARAHSIEISP